jgi:glutathione-regulated potassium-efflux system ancillary protein KefC
MTQIWALASLWLGLALLATLVSISLRIATALSEIVVGAIARLVIGALIGATLLCGLSHGIIDVPQYSALVATVLASAVVPTVIANAAFLLRHLLPRAMSGSQDPAHAPRTAEP